MNNNLDLAYGNSPQQSTVDGSRTFVANVFSWMAVALAISGLIAWQFGHNMELMSYLINPERGGLSALGYIVIFSPLAFSLIIGFGFEKLSYTAMMLIFMLYAVCMGMSLSFIFMVYTAASIYSTFAIAAGMFGVMALAGYTTKTDLTKMGSLLIMAVIGLVIASLINFFVHSEGLSYIIGFIGVIVFTGLTAYQVQMIKSMANMAGADTVRGKKLALWAALSLYVTFINLFMSLLRLFGNRRD